MGSGFESLVKADIKFIVCHPMLLLAILAPFLMILLLRIVFSVVSSFIFLKTGFLLDNYYSLVAITFVSLIPMLYGMVFCYILLDEMNSQMSQDIAVTPAGKKNLFYMRMIVMGLLCFLMVLLTIVFTNPVPSEGWLRTVFISFLLPVQSFFVFLFIGGFARNKVQCLALSKLCGVFLLAVPFGLLLHHPWNYFAFFSPLYWISWAWVTSVLAESIIFGTISMIISFGSILIFFRHFIKNKLTN